MIRKKLRSGLVIGSIASCGFVATTAGAAVNPAAATSRGINPASVNPANVMHTLDETLPGGPIPPKQGELTLEENPQPTQSGKSSSQFVLQKVEILGAENHPIPANVKAVYQAMIGKAIDIKDVQTIAAQMEQAYRDDGYLLVQVILPPQEIDLKKGTVQFQVIEGQIEAVIFNGDSPQAALTQLERYAKKIEEEDPVTYQTLDRFLTLANQIPGIDVSATLVPSKKVVGAADLLVKIKQTPASAFINFNNRGTEYIGPGQASAGASIYDILGADALSFTGATSTSNPDQLQYGGMSYDLIIGPYGTEINPSVTATQTKPGSTLAVFDMEGQSTKLNLSVNQPLYVSTVQNLSFQSSLYHLESEDNVFGTQLYDDEITALSLGLDYQGVFWQSYNDFNISSSFGMPILGAPSTLSNPSIAGGKTDFVAFNINTSSIHYFTDKISMLLASETQLTPDTMLSSEQIGYGGQSFGEAYIPYVISGDNGVMGSLALRYDLPTVGPIQLIQPEVFYDVGAVWLNSPSVGSAGGASAESAGFGLTMQVWNQWQLGLTLAKPIKITQTPGTPLGWQAFFNLTGVF